MKKNGKESIKKQEELHDMPTSILFEKLRLIKPDEIDDVFSLDKPYMIKPKDSYYTFVRDKLKEHGWTQYDVFSRADVRTSYGYKILNLNNDKVPHRDLFIRIFYMADFTLDETQKALKLSNNTPLYPKRRRDAIIISAFNAKKRNIDEMNEILVRKGEKPLQKSSGKEEK